MKKDRKAPSIFASEAKVIWNAYLIGLVMFAIFTLTCEFPGPYTNSLR